MRFADFTHLVTTVGRDINVRTVNGTTEVLTWDTAAWVTAPVCEVADSLADSTQLYPTGQDFVGLLGFARPFVASTGLAIDYVLVGMAGDSDQMFIIARPSKERVQEWVGANLRTAAYNEMTQYPIRVTRGRAIPLDRSAFIMPGEAKPGMTCADMKPLASYVVACLQLLASETVTEVVDETPVPTQGGGRRSHTCHESPVVIRSHGLVRKVRESLGTGRTATRRWWVRGHFRNQAYGPKRAFRRRIFIAPHTAGAATAPEPEQDTRPVVTVLRKGA